MKLKSMKPLEMYNRDSLTAKLLAKSIYVAVGWTVRARRYGRGKASAKGVKDSVYLKSSVEGKKERKREELV